MSQWLISLYCVTFSLSVVLFVCVCVVLQELVQYYQENSLKECFKDVDSNLQTPYKQPEQNTTSQTNTHTHNTGNTHD